VLETILRALAVSCAALALLGVPQVHAGEPAEDADAVRRGKLLFVLQCRACHEVAVGQPHKVGPNLHGLIDRPAAAAGDFVYSQALADSGMTWDVATLDRWLDRPGAVVAGTTMAYAGMPSAADPSAVIAYLAQATR